MANGSPLPSYRLIVRSYLGWIKRSNGVRAWRARLCSPTHKLHRHFDVVIASTEPNFRFPFFLFRLRFDADVVNFEIWKFFGENDYCYQRCNRGFRGHEKSNLIMYEELFGESMIIGSNVWLKFKFELYIANIMIVGLIGRCYAIRKKS